MIQAVIFDKDGTLFDFRQSWGAWTAAVLRRLAPDARLAARLAHRLGFDPERYDFAPDSPVIAGTVGEVAGLLAGELPGWDPAAIDRLLVEESAAAPMAPVPNLSGVLHDLRARGLVLGLATNDAEVPARRHLAAAGVLDLFDFVAGYDSGWGGKPAPGQLRAFVAAHALDPARVAMVGDSLHDLAAARAAGMKAVAVLTGIADAATLAADADIVLLDIGALPAWIDRIS